MKSKVLVSEQVERFVKALAPEPQRALTRALKALPKDRGDSKQLEGKLLGFQRLRVARYRVIYRVCVVRGERHYECIYANERSLVYELFAQFQLDELAG